MYRVKGFGVRKLGDPTPVDEKTFFAIGSSSKAFTAAAIAMLVDQIEGAPEGFFVQFDVAGAKPGSMTIEQGAGPKLTLTLKP